jgi:ribulose-5-phosphate 4-epimerase/fuculose-1-phosphate aldolase
MADEKQLSITENGQVLAEATVVPPDPQGEARAQVSVAPGHLPVGTRRKMADAVHDAVVADEAARLTATVPLGDAELVDGIREHLSEAQIRAAGSTSIIRGDMKAD